MYLSFSLSLSHLFYFFSPFSSPNPDVSWLYIFSQDASGLYIWRVRITLPWYLSHQGLTSRFYTEVFSCVGTVHGHFPINAVRQVVAMHLMRREWLLCPSSLSSLVPSYSTLSSGCTMLPLPWVLVLSRLGGSPRSLC